MEILLPTAEKQNEILTKVSDIQNKVAQGDSGNSGGSKPYTSISYEEAKGVHEGTTDRKLIYSIEGKGFAEKFLFYINASGLFEVIVDGVTTQKIKLASQIPVGFFQAEDRKIMNSNRVFFFGANNYFIPNALLSYPHDVENTTAYTTYSISEVSPIVFDKSFEVYFTPNESTNGYSYSSNRVFRGGVY